MSISVLFLLLACADEPPPEVHKLTDLWSPVVRLNTGSVPGGPEIIQLFVHPQLVGKCHPIPTIAATLDGKPMTRLHGRVEGPEPYDRDCSVYEFSLDPKDLVKGAAHELTVTDGATSWTVGFTDIFSPRTITPSATEVKPGDTVTLTWSPASDVVAPEGDLGLELKVGEKRTVLKRKDLVLAPGSITFQVPADVDGDVTVSVFGTAAIQPAVTKCEGPTTCGVSREYDVPPVTLRVVK